MLALHLSIIFLLIVINGFFAMAEFALVAAREARLRPFVESGSRGAEAAIELKRDPGRLLSTVQIGITLIAVLLGTFGEATLGDRLQSSLIGYPGLVGEYAHAFSMAVVVIGISYFSLVCGELVPKRVALAHAEPIAAAISRSMRALALVAAPAGWLLSASTRFVLRLLPVKSEGPAPVTDEEIAFMLREGVAAGYIEEAETAIVGMALKLGERRVSAVMTPRMQIEWLDLKDPEEENRRKIRDSAYSRFPLVEGGLEQVVGIAAVKDLFAASLSGRSFDLKAVTRSPLYLPNTVTVLRALEVFKTAREPMGLIVDEYGDLEGLVTLTDILEALVGDIPDSAGAGQRVVRREDGTWLIDGMLGLDELKDALKISRLPGEDPEFHTLGGYLMARLNRVPMVADRVSISGWRFEVVEMDGRRVDRVLVSPLKAKTRLG